MSGANDGGMRLAFSTLGCPDWSLERVAEAAREYGYDGLELRLVDGELLAPHPSQAERERMRAVLQGVPVVAVDTSLRMAAPEPGWEDDLRGYCEVAVELGCDLLRVFGGTATPGDDTGIVDHLRTAGAIAGASGVRVVLETHDDFSSARAVQRVLAQVPEPAVGALWDLHHPYRMGEEPEEVWDLIGARTLLVHVKDAVRDETERTGWKLVLLGEGEVPVQRSLTVLRERGYRGWV
ncbi:MAG: sugar phosphate isomerase/epimerase, partial [Candidatus Dormibacteraeota bacterium]|nr:sugar phosphate isomerase/epimerase [Candidatus Dormibacteraeota bacterium]